MKVFGVGFQRTGLMSLTTALNMLGIKTLQFPKELFYKIDDEIIDLYDGFIDNPVPIIYKKLDEAYPGSKFIHSLRDEEKWLRSVEWLFSTGAEKFNWKNHHYADEFHKALYGTVQFERELFLNTFRAYNNEVAEYFKDRPNDYITIEIEKGEGFDKLCPFLNRPLPADPFPHRNQKENIVKVRTRKLYRQVRSGIRHFLK